MTDDQLSPQEMDDYLRLIAEPTLFMIRTDKQTDKGTPDCYYGGEPTLPADIEWPVFKCPDPRVDIPMNFIVGETFPPETFLLGINAQPDPSRYFGNLDFGNKIDDEIQKNEGKYHDSGDDGYGGRTEAFKPPHYLFGASSLQSFMSEEMVMSDRYPNHQVMTKDHICLVQLLGLDPVIGFSTYDGFPISAWILKDDLENRYFGDVQFWGY